MSKMECDIAQLYTDQCDEIMYLQVSFLFKIVTNQAKFILCVPQKCCHILLSLQVSQPTMCFLGEEGLPGLKYHPENLIYLKAI